MVRTSSILALAFLTGCPDESVPEPKPESGIELQEGAYELRVLDVIAVECEGIRPRDLIGQSLYAELETRGTDAVLWMDGFELSGVQKGGVLDVSGGMAYEDTEPVPETRDGEDEGDVGTADAKDVEAAPSYEVNASLVARIHSTRSAIGDLSIDMDGCSLGVVVSMAWGEAGDDPVVVDVEEDEDHGETADVE